ncbi:acetyl-CoA carboxylase biotin carboxyl carrier protein [Marchantia polymorpha subsp. ruderalis]|uniref:Lipoyl-binding domain-containing protein n=2 Tax=Marchantia polymorpha TaxID=3197 RepID=A0A176VWN7_MARPO|nr:hypothetical protein AXG93_2210s1080 [Marchantia polymorpha subsp. ruderalis]PTQ47453.1 hypothetical protein MARPO_0008s0204 [Marchantia polymorpha]BBN19379.1 hypothetical protein Mp_8g10180 [Marchantia polymorpha subsp. ruderalis]|eukprot:PTQ47453.1 hypothetical protein MARPO_0008s0204 [Marchantia polymorpha]
MASAATVVSCGSGLGLKQIHAFSTAQDVRSRSSARLVTVRSCPAHLKASFSPSRGASNEVSRINCVSPATDGLLLDVVPEPKEPQESSLPSPSTFEIQSLLMEVCDETSIAELELKVGEFKLHVRRDVGKLKGSAVPATAPALPPVPTKPMVDSRPPAPTAAPSSSPKSNNSITAMTGSFSKTASLFGLLEAAADEGLLFVTSPKVGVFRKGRTAKGKSSKPMVEEGLVIKSGQVVCYLEQLGTQQPVESEVSGEVVKVLWDDGEPVGYGDPLIAVRPSFPGIVSSRGTVMN